jgi:non-ribosomal peptide synthase protein (TIGR01720 family)
LRAVLFEPEDGEPSRLVIALHRLIADGVSWRLLLSDLVAVYRGLEAGEELAPPAAASTFKRWAERLSEYAQEGAVVEEGAYWLDDGWPASSALPLLAGGDGAGATEAVEVLLSREESRVLLREVPAIYRARPYEILLSALARILTSRSGSPIVIEVERHDRESLFEGLDVAQTVGPLSIAFPLALDLAGASWPEGALVAVKEQVRRLPRRGLAYGALRYLGEEAVRERLRSLPSPEIGFSFLDLDEVGGSGWDPSPWRIVAGPSSPALAARPTCERLRLDAAAVGGRLHLTWSCREDACSRPLLEALAHELTAELEALVAHARWPGARADVPSDFPLAQIDDDELSRLSSALEEIDHTELGSTC